MRLAAMVPTTTITNAAAPTSAPALEPLRIAPPMIANRPSTMPTIVRISIVLRRQPLRQSGAQPNQRLPVDLADPGFGHFEHFADLAQIHVLVVIKREHQPLAFGQAGDGRRQRVAEARLLDVIEGAGTVVA